MIYHPPSVPHDKKRPITTGNDLRADPERYEKITLDALHPDLSPERIKAVVAKHVQQMLERAEVLEQVLSGHASFAYREQAKDPLLPNTTHGGFFGPRPTYTSRNAQERWEEEFYAKPVWKEEEKEEPATCTVGTAVNVNAAGCDVRGGDDVDAASLGTSMYYPDGEQQVIALLAQYSVWRLNTCTAACVCAR